jgi:hypothetical protein
MLKLTQLANPKVSPLVHEGFRGIGLYVSGTTDFFIT